MDGNSLGASKVTLVPYIAAIVCRHFDRRHTGTDRACEHTVIRRRFRALRVLRHINPRVYSLKLQKALEPLNNSSGVVQVLVTFQQSMFETQRF